MDKFDRQEVEALRSGEWPNPYDEDESKDDEAEEDDENEDIVETRKAKRETEQALFRNGGLRSFLTERRGV